MDTLVIEVSGQAVHIQLEAPPELVFEVEGIQGPPGPEASPEAGDAIRVVGDVVHFDISKLTLAP